MKRINNLYKEIISLENLEAAELIARKRKSKQQGVKLFDKDKDHYLSQLHEILKSKKYKTSEYKNFIIHEPKERIISKLKYYPDRIVHHGIMRIMEPYFVRWFTADTYSCIKGRGVLKASMNLRKALLDLENTQYCLKIDIVKFYSNINHDVLKMQLRRKIKDNNLLDLLDEIIDSAPGVPIGNYLSQYFANFYLTGFDHFIKEQMSVKHYFRYADDIVILGKTKKELHVAFQKIVKFLGENLKLQVKGNYQIFKVIDRGIDFVGYVHFHTHTLLRKTIKKGFARAVTKGKDWQVIAAYLGWAKHANTKNLIKKLFRDDSIQRFRDRAKKRRIRRRSNSLQKNTG